MISNFTRAARARHGAAAAMAVAAASVVAGAAGIFRSRMDANSIWQVAQNRPSQVVDDLAAYVNADVVYETLLKRGIFKWLAVRRTLITTKNIWRDRVTRSIERQRKLMEDQHALRSSTSRFDQKLRAKMLRQAAEERGYRRGIEQCRAEVRAMCHSARWQAPDNDRAAQKWLAKREA